MIKNQLIICFFILLFNKVFASSYIDKGFYVIDLKNQIEWLKCTTGQQWSDKENTCVGKAVKLEYNAINDAITSGSKITGCSAHFVEPEVDSGSLIMQAALSISDQDNIDSITKKIHFLEHKILPLSISEAGYISRNGLGVKTNHFKSII